MADTPFGFQQQIDPGLLQKLADSGNNSGWGPIVNQISQAIQQGIQGQKQKQQQQSLMALLSQVQQGQQPQQAPQLPGVGMPGMPAPRSGMGAQRSPQQLFNGIDPSQMIQALGPQVVSQMLQSRINPPTPPPVKPTSPWKVVPNL